MIGQTDFTIKKTKILYSSQPHFLLAAVMSVVAMIHTNGFPLAEMNTWIPKAVGTSICLTY